MNKIYHLLFIFLIFTAKTVAQSQNYCLTVEKVSETSTTLTVKFFIKITSTTPVVADISLNVVGSGSVSGSHIVAGYVNASTGQLSQVFNPTQNLAGTYAYKIVSPGTARFSLDDISLKGLGVYTPLKIAKEAACAINNLKVLPLTFNAIKLDEKALLTWATVREENLSYFAIERSNDSIKFSQIGFVKALGNSLITQKYEFIDESPLSGTNYYRLRIVDENAQYEYSKNLSLKFVKPLSATIYPNPFEGDINIDLHVDRTAGEVNLELLDVLGKLLYQKKIQPATDNLNIVLPISDFPVGAYVIRAKNGNDSWQQKVTKQ
jgi:hypothetical protein